MLDLWLAIGHHLIIFALFGVLAVELILLRRDMNFDVVGRSSHSLPFCRCLLRSGTSSGSGRAKHRAARMSGA